ncbi:MAG: hypothetical protein IJW17_12505, partial [Lentisphaeria bacterium]|nr:hypothetical protein [Lentisphaeria bacterium]
KLCRQDFCCLGTENLRKLTKTRESALDFYIIEPIKIRKNSKKFEKKCFLYLHFKKNGLF